MDKYLQISFYTLTGIRKFIDLGDLSYAEWVIYDGDKPEYHINLNADFRSDRVINAMINKNKDTIDGILKKINIKHNSNLNFGAKPWIQLVKKEELID